MFRSFIHGIFFLSLFRAKLSNWKSLKSLTRKMRIYWSPTKARMTKDFGDRYDQLSEDRVRVQQDQTLQSMTSSIFSASLQDTCTKGFSRSWCWVWNEPQNLRSNSGSWKIIFHPRWRSSCRSIRGVTGSTTNTCSTNGQGGWISRKKSRESFGVTKSSSSTSCSRWMWKRFCSSTPIKLSGKNYSMGLKLVNFNRRNIEMYFIIHFLKLVKCRTFISNCIKVQACFLTFVRDRKFCRPTRPNLKQFCFFPSPK